MANLVTDKNRLSVLLGGNGQAPAADRLFRDQNVFFVGGALPVYETLETMFESFCTEATALFFLTFGPRETLLQGEEMARQIKKNFNTRLMADIDPSVDTPTLERIYAAGVDNVVFSLPGHGNAGEGLPSSLQTARTVFPHWGAAAKLLLGDEAPAITMVRIDALLQEGIMPLLEVTDRSKSLTLMDIDAVLNHLVSGWDRDSVPLSAYHPLITVLTPLVATKPAGLFRGIVDKLRDRHQLAGSDIRRHLRVQHAADSLDSAGL